MIINVIQNFNASVRKVSSLKHATLLFNIVSSLNGKQVWSFFSIILFKNLGTTSTLIKL